jgi:hypothetical protein
VSSKYKAVDGAAVVFENGIKYVPDVLSLVVVIFVAVVAVVAVVALPFKHQQK